MYEDLLFPFRYKTVAVLWIFFAVMGVERFLLFTDLLLYTV